MLRSARSARLEAWAASPSFETRSFGPLLRMRSEWTPAQPSIGRRFGRSTQTRQAMRYCRLFRSQTHGPISPITGDDHAIGWGGRCAAFAPSIVHAACRERTIQKRRAEGPQCDDSAARASRTRQPRHHPGDPRRPFREFRLPLLPAVRAFRRPGGQRQRRDRSRHDRKNHRRDLSEL